MFDYENEFEKKPLSIYHSVISGMSRFGQLATTPAQVVFVMNFCWKVLRQEAFVVARSGEQMNSDRL